MAKRSKKTMNNIVKQACVEFGRIQLPKGKTANERAKDRAQFSLPAILVDGKTDRDRFIEKCSALNKNAKDRAAQFTPGPWAIGKSQVFKGRTLIGPGVAIVLGEGKTPSANASLIAATPDLINELTNLIDAARVVVERWESGDLADAVNGLRVDADRAQVVLDKATK